MQNRAVSGHLPVFQLLFPLKVERVVSHSHRENAHATCVLQPSHVTANMNPHAAQQVEIAAIRGATEQERTPLLLCTIFPFLLRPPRSPPLCLFVYVCF